jgi:hypothetical protein
MSTLLSTAAPFPAALIDGLRNDLEEQVCRAVIEIMNAAPLPWLYDVDQFSAGAVREAVVRLERLRGRKLDRDPQPKSVIAERAQPLASLTPEQIEKRECYDRWRALMERQAGKPVTVELHPRCWAVFGAEHVATCRRIVEDAEIRAEQVWAHEKNMKWIPGPLEYLMRRLWEVDTIRRRPTGAQRAEESRRREESEFLNRFSRERSL